jgi:hypothetical protein
LPWSLHTIPAKVSALVASAAERASRAGPGCGATLPEENRLFPGLVWPAPRHTGVHLALMEAKRWGALLLNHSQRDDGARSNARGRGLPAAIARGAAALSFPARLRGLHPAAGVAQLREWSQQGAAAADPAAAAAKCRSLIPPEATLLGVGRPSTWGHEVDGQDDVGHSGAACKLMNKYISFLAEISLAKLHQIFSCHCQQ